MTVAAAIVDLDGTVYRGSAPIPNAAAGVRALRAAGVDVLFFSNNPTRPVSAYVEKLERMGIETTAEEILTSGVITTSYLRERHAADDLFVVGTEGLRTQFRTAGLSVVENAGLADVLVGSWDPSFDYETMAAVLSGFDDEFAFVGTDPDRTFPHEDGTMRPGSGAIINALAGVLDAEPDAVLGKPASGAVDAALDRLDVPPSDCLVVGDRLDTDVELGQRAGMTTALVTTGVTDAEAAATADAPDYVLDDLGDVTRLL
ncbi:HAD-IIA family hydrolase [Haloarculaceae archaeon H-GB2-1]|nr:HAD-IIA family hydrolase [Haloarculaceae archaeon H-GB1-1]MEA5386362.1 HAD-IIA family hydrolase [Haloarculaceae archaeon H-GB11]MEA5407867.1 HAD-IIA family hydrolase [Haloarculaceae archaeon H-GB2-1]